MLEMPGGAGESANSGRLAGHKLHQAVASAGTDRDRPVEAGAAAGMAAAAVAADPDLEPKGVLVAVDAHLDDGLGLAAGGALAPQLAPQARPIPRLAGLNGSGERLTVHVGYHQDLAAAGVGGHARDEPVRPE